ncbi:MAG: hypothetical protein JNK66_12830 [Chitinophagales bacterium]|nr:hypothetical protein [Chitinophagales bacterium]
MNLRDKVKHELKTKTLWVQWQVTCNIGPDWVGSSRDIQFYINAEPVEDNDFHSFLKDCLIEKLNIPEKSEEDMIEGEGDLLLLGNDVMIKYAISYTVPYNYPHKYENGEVVLITY